MMTYLGDNYENVSYEELKDRYHKLKKWLWKQDIYIPIDIEPYTEEERELRDRLPQIYWTSRDYEDCNRSGKNECMGLF